MSNETASRTAPTASLGTLRASAYMGLLVAGAVMFFVPWLLASQFSLNVAPAWGLGNAAFVVCAAGALIGMLVGRRMKL